MLRNALANVQLDLMYRPFSSCRHINIHTGAFGFWQLSFVCHWFMLAFTDTFGCARIHNSYSTRLGKIHLCIVHIHAMNHTRHYGIGPQGPRACGPGRLFCFHLDRTDRLCLVCKSLDCMEDEQHFVFDCPAYSHIRSQHLEPLQHCCTAVPLQTL